MNFSKWQSQQDIDAALREKTIAVVGLSSNPTRPSHDVAHVMQRRGYQVYPLIRAKPACLTNLLSRPGHAAAATGPIRLVNVFRESNAVPAIAREAVNIGAQFLWLQLGVFSAEGIQIAEAGGMTCIVDRCLKVEHLRRNARS